MSVTYLIPLFGVAWGALFLGERITLPMVFGMLVILAGVGLATSVPAARPSASLPQDSVIDDHEDTRAAA